MYKLAKDHTGAEKMVLENPSLLWKKGQPIEGIIPAELAVGKDGTLRVVSYSLVSRQSAVKAAEAWLSMRGYSIEGTLTLSKYVMGLPRLLKPLSPFFRTHKADAYIAVIDLKTAEPRKVIVTKLLDSPNLLAAIDWERTSKRSQKPAVHIYPDKPKSGKEDTYTCLLPPSFTVAARCGAEMMKDMSEFVRNAYGSCYERFMDTVQKVNEPVKEKELPDIRETEKNRSGRSR